jgi:hypothetical protein
MHIVQHEKLHIMQQQSKDGQNQLEYIHQEHIHNELLLSY